MDCMKRTKNILAALIGNKDSINFPSSIGAEFLQSKTLSSNLKTYLKLLCLFTLFSNKLSPTIPS